jgi:hypothetical protein
MRLHSFILIILLLVSSSFAQRDLGVRPTDTGGPLMPEQAAFDVQTYDITLNVDTKTKSIAGTTVMPRWRCAVYGSPAY